MKYIIIFICFILVIVICHHASGCDKSDQDKTNIEIYADDVDDVNDKNSVYGARTDDNYMDGMSGTDDQSYLDNIVKKNGLSGRPFTGAVEQVAKFRITKAETLRYLYELLRILDKVFKQNNLEYWIECGTFLGAIRHKSIIPWDDDGDVEIWKKDEELLKSLKSIFASYDVVLMPTWFGYKIFFNYGKPIKGHKWLYPSIDIFVMDEQNGKVIYSYPRAQSAFGHCYFDKQTMYPLEQYKLGPLELTGVSKKASKKYLDTCYGDDWSTHAYQMFDHENETPIKSEKVQIAF